MTCANARLVTRVVEVLWPGGNADYEWDSETVEEVAEVLKDYRPKPPELVCEECQSSNVQQYFRGGVWVNPNTGEEDVDSEGGLQQSYCNDCEEERELVAPTGE